MLKHSVTDQSKKIAPSPAQNLAVSQSRSNVYSAKGQSETLIAVYLSQNRRACKFVFHNRLMSFRCCNHCFWKWCECEGLLLTSSWLCAGVVVVLVLTSHRVGTVSKLSVLMKDWASAYSDSESAGEENRELVERSSMQDRSWRQRKRGGVKFDFWNRTKHVAEQHIIQIFLILKEHNIVTVAWQNQHM